MLAGSAVKFLSIVCLVFMGLSGCEKKIRIYLIVAGVFLVFLGGYLYYLRVESIINTLVITMGFPFLLGGFRYKNDHLCRF